MGTTGDQYVRGGVNWAAFTLQQLVNMVADKASVPQLEELADDWRTTGEGVTAAADYLAEALDDLMSFWTGASAEQARHVVALNAQWVGDLGVTAKEMGDPIDEAAGALKAAQEGMPELPAPAAVPAGSAPDGALEGFRAADGSQLGAAVGGVAAGSESAFQSQADEEELKRIAVETMQRFEAAALGIDQSTPQFEGQSAELRQPRLDGLEAPGDGEQWVDKVNGATGVDARWQALTGMTDASGAGSRGGSVGSVDDLGGGVFSGSGGGAAIGGGGGGASAGPLIGRGAIGEVPDRVAMTGRVPGAGALGAGAAPGMTGPIGGAPMAGGGAGGGAGGQEHRRRVPYEGEDPFDTGEQASKPVIGL
jgi:hypothetical protein